MTQSSDNPSRSRGDKRSSWATFRRRLIVVRRLLHSPATVQDLVNAAEAEQGNDAYPPAAALAVKHDIQSLRDEFGCQIRYQRRERIYRMEDLGDLALLDLPDAGLEALAVLDATFPEQAPVSGNDQIRLLIGQIYGLLPRARREALGRQLTLPRVSWDASSTEVLDQPTLHAVQQAVSLRRLLTFEYHSNYDPDDRPLSYTVAPYVLYFRDAHTYLDSTVMRAPSEHAQLYLRAVQFRMDRFVPKSARMSHEPMPDERPPQPVYELVYVLAAAVARNRDLPHWFPNTTITYRNDGSALVRARITNLWQARQILMRYIEHCQVLEPPELVAMFQQTARNMAATYGIGYDEVEE